MTLEGGKGGREGRGGEGRGGEGREGEKRGGEGREGGREGMTVVMAPQYLNSNHVTYYVITCTSVLEQWYVIITYDVNGTATRIPSQINSQELVYKQVMSIPVK